MIVSDAHNFASRLSRNMEEIQRERQMYIEKLSSGKKVEKSTDDAGALSNKIKQAERTKKTEKVNRKSYKMPNHTSKFRDSALENVHKIYDRMAQLSTMAMDGK